MLVDEVVRAAGRAVAKSAFDLIYADPHSWSTRPCPTCRAVSALFDVPFGCSRKALEALSQEKSRAEDR